MSDPGSTYRTRDEVSSMRQARDPVERVRKLLLDNKFAEAAELKSIEKRIKKEIDEAIEEAKAAGQPEREWLQARLAPYDVGCCSCGTCGCHESYLHCSQVRVTSSQSGCRQTSTATRATR